MALVELARYFTAMEAQISRTRLGSYGIDSIVFDGSMNIADGANLEARLMVLDEDFDEAMAILSADAIDLDNSADADDETICKHDS